MRLTWFGHSSFKIEIDGTIVYVDPVRTNRLLDLSFDSADKADAVLITHEHWDHCDPAAVALVLKEDTRIIAPEEIMNVFVNGLTFHVAALEELDGVLQRVDIVTPGSIVSAVGCKITVFEASEGVSFLLRADKKILFMGDSLLSEEMLAAVPDYVVYPRWGLSEVGEADMLERLPGSTRIVICHYHTKKSAFPNFYAEESSITKALDDRLLTLRRTLSIEL